MKVWMIHWKTTCTFNKINVFYYEQKEMESRSMMQVLCMYCSMAKGTTQALCMLVETAQMQNIHIISSFLAL